MFVNTTYYGISLKSSPKCDFVPSGRYMCRLYLYIHVPVPYCRNVYTGILLELYTRVHTRNSSIFSSNCGSPAESLRFFCTKFRANRKTGRIFPPHVSQGTPAFLKITFQLHRNPTVLIRTCTTQYVMYVCTHVLVHT